MELGWMVVLTVVLAGGAVGFLSGLFGVGGGFLIVPVLNVLLGIPMPFAIGAGASQVLGPATTSLRARRIRFAQLRLPLILGGGLAVGVYTGIALLEAAKDAGEITVAGRIVPAAEFIVLLVYFVLLAAVGGFALWDARRNPVQRLFARGWIDDWKIPPYVRLADFRFTRISIVVLAWFGLAVGFLSGLLGMSGGLILLPGFIFLFGMRTHQAVMNTLVIVWLVGFQSTITHALHGNIDLALVVALLVGGTIGARLGTDLSRKLVGGQLRRGFGWLLLAAAGIAASKLAALFFAP